MATVAECEARVNRGEAAIREREASGTPVPPAWYTAYNDAWETLLALVEAEQRRAVQGVLALGQGRGR